MLGLLILGPLCLFIAYKMGPNSKTKKMYKENYLKALKEGNKGEALMWGRKYYESQRITGLLTIYDEQAIQNDINAHCK